MAELLGLTEDGAILAGANPDAFAVIQKVVQPIDACEAKFKGTFGEFLQKHQDDEAMTRSLQNIVKKCKVCGKANGFSMATCNGCNTPIPADQELAYTENVLMGFVYGVERTDRFPLNISIRRQTEKLLVFDDVLALTPCHLNVIPTHAWIADWRMLLRKPAEALELVTSLEDAAWGCLCDQVLSDAEWRAKCFRDGGPPASQLRKYVCAGCNFPPSQFQLHVQYFIMPWLPSQYKSFLEGGQMVPQRWFPIEYIKDVLRLNDAMETTMETKVEEILAKYDDRVNYKEYYDRSQVICAEGHELLANWKPDDFGVKIKDDEVLGDAQGRSKQDIVTADKKTLQSMSAPAAKTYYRYAHSERVPEWPC